MNIGHCFAPRIAVVILLCAGGALFADRLFAEEAPVFGPRQYDVSARYGADNWYREALRTTPGMHVLKIQNGLQASSRPDSILLSINGTRIIDNDQFGYPYFACFIALGKDAIIELNLKDHKPSGLSRPVLPARSLTLSAQAAPRAFPEGLYGLLTWESLNEFINTVRRIASAESQSLAALSSDLRRPAAARAEAVRALGARRDRSAREFLLLRYRDIWAAAVVRAEAAVALAELGDVQMIPALLDGVVAPQETLRKGAARALSLYPEEASRAGLSQRLSRLDPLMKTAVLRSIADSGWKPFGTISELALSTDPHVAAVAIELLGHMRDRRATDLLLKQLSTPREGTLTSVIQALGESRDARAVDPLLVIARDPSLRKGREAAVGTALAVLGDQRAEEAIRELAGAVMNAPDYLKLLNAYRTLTGKELEQNKK